jgi:hypothetical protein
LNDEAEAYAWCTVDEALRLPMDAYTEKVICTYLVQRQTARDALQGEG